MRESWRRQGNLSQPADRPGDTTPQVEQSEKKPESAADREFRLASQVLKFLEFADAHPEEPEKVTEKFQDLDSELSGEDQKEWRRRLLPAGFTVEESPDETDETNKTNEPQTTELARFKNEGDMEQGLGESAGEIDGVKYWHLDDGAVAFVPPGAGHGQRIGEGGYFQLNKKWYEFKDGRFTTITAQEAKSRSTSISSGKMTAEERRMAARQQRSPEGTQAPEKAKAGKEKAGAEPKERELKRAEEIFDREYDENKRSSLARAFNAAVNGLRGDVREKYEHAFRERFKDVPSALLDGIIRGGNDLERIDRRPRTERS